MRIIAGKYGGRRLSSFKADHIRPTTDRVKEAIFNRIQFDIEGAQVLDLFSGTGNLAFEALSRGAQGVLAVESHPKSIQLIRKNKSLLGVGGELTINKSDIYLFCRSVQTAFDIIFVDPPFTKKMAHEVMQALSQSACFHKESQLFIESSAQEEMGERYGPLSRCRMKSYGDKILSQFIYTPDADSAD